MRKSTVVGSWRLIAGLLMGFAHPLAGDVKGRVYELHQVEVSPRIHDQGAVVYPEELRSEGVVGDAMVTLVVDREGRPHDAEVVTSHHDLFGQAALESVRDTRYVPARNWGRTVNCRVVQHFQFDPSMEAPATDPDSFAKRFDAPPKVVRQGPPTYPQYMRMANISGEVNVGFAVNRAGGVEFAFATRSSHPAFREAAVEAVEKWKFKPARKDGEPVAALMQVPIIFSISNERHDSGWKISRPRKWGSVPESLRWDRAPRMLHFEPPIYPRSALMNRIKDKVNVRFLIGPGGHVLQTRVVTEGDPDLAAAAVAAVETFRFDPARKDSVPCGALLSMVFDFNPNGSGDAVVSREAKRLIKMEAKTPEKIVTQGLDERPVPIFTSTPRRPTTGLEDGQPAEAKVRFFISRKGTVELPEVLEATSPGVGYAAIQAISSWQFYPPTVDGKPVDTRVVVPVVFSERDSS